ncbi:hypothetical protein JW890_02915 [candidate division WOR-3 bacterium]|nr:hypothetical protein [candidate division WOR-3 bacterium]
MKPYKFVLVFFSLFFSVNYLSSNTFENWIDFAMFYDEFRDAQPNADRTKIFAVGRSVIDTTSMMNFACFEENGGIVWFGIYENIPYPSHARAISKSVSNDGFISLGNAFYSGRWIPLIVKFQDADSFFIIKDTLLNYASSEYFLTATDIIPYIGGSGYLLTGYADSAGSGTIIKPFIILIDQDFSIVWERYYNIPGYSQSYSNSMTMNDSIIALTGYCVNPLSFDKDVFVLLAGLDGTSIDARAWGYLDGNEIGECIVALIGYPDRFAVTGIWRDSLFVMLYGGEDTLWCRQYIFDSALSNCGKGIVIAPDYSLTVSGFTGDISNMMITGLVLLNVSNSNGQVLWSNYVVEPGLRAGFNIFFDGLDSSYIVPGLITQNPLGDTMHDAFLLKSDLHGFIHHEFSYIFSGMGDDEFNSVFSMGDSSFTYGYLIAGFVDTSGTDTDMYLSFLDTRGVPLWEGIIGEPGYSEKAKAFVHDPVLQKTMVSGTVEYGSNRDIFCYHFDADWNLIDTFYYHQDTSRFTLYDITHFEDSTKLKGFIMTGATRSTTKDSVEKIFAIKIDENFNVLWDTVYESIESRTAYCLVQDSSFGKLKGFIMTGATRSTTKDTIDRVFAMKISEDGSVVWEQTYFEGEAKAAMNCDAGVILIGYRQRGDKDLFAAVIDRDNGNIIWLTDPVLVGDQVGYDLTRAHDTIYVCGYSKNSIQSPTNFMNAVIMKFDRFSNYLGLVEFIEDGNQAAYSIDYVRDNSFVWSGFTDYDGQSNRDAIFEKAYSGYIYTVSVEENPDDPSKFQRPFALFSPSKIVFSESVELGFHVFSECPVEFRVFDATGREVKTFARSFLLPGYYGYIWRGEDNSGVKLPSGSYFFSLSSGNFRETGKLLLVK